MPADSLETLLDNPAMREAVSVVVERSKRGTEELRWCDVNDALSSGQWGRLIERGVLTDAAAGGFVLSDPDRIASKLQSRDPGVEGGSDDADSSWSRWDRLGALGVVVLFAGYWNAGVRNAVAGIDNVVLGALAHSIPFYAVVIVLAAATGLYSTVMQDRLKDTELLERHQARMDDLKSRREAAKERGDDDALERIEAEQMEAMGDQWSVMKAQFKPMVWIMLVTIPAFLWMRWKVRGGHVAADSAHVILPLVGRVGWQDAVFGPMPAWIVWYFLCSFAARQLCQKFLGIDPSGTVRSDSESTTSS
ncbi:DUF106 domain-containing protein [Haloferax volcanii]|uniref:DUF106 domain-containing protein n=1 Tax=Haloferax volcanii TaxID=2246 RepID=UPI00249C45E9|nr:DUF106 domain-containing protein [Haloferax alexandrinus]